MAAANSQPHIMLSPFRGKPDKNWPDLESLFRSLINAGNILTANQPQFYSYPFWTKPCNSLQLYHKSREIILMPQLQF